MATNEGVEILARHPFASFDHSDQLAGLSRQGGDHAPRLDRLGSVEAVLERPADIQTAE